jgi:hypothetical protein
MADQEHRARLMGQHLDLLLNTYSKAPVNRKCPMCAQSGHSRPKQHGRRTRVTGQRVFDFVYFSLVFNLVVQC